MLGSILFAPVRGVGFVFREIAKAVRQSLEAEREGIMASLRALHQRYERGEIDEAAFGAQETVFLDRLDEIQAQLDQR